MSPFVHAELAWLAAQRLPARRDRMLIALAGVAPDLDGLGIVLAPWDGGAAYGTWHHLLGHSIFAALACATVCVAFARDRLRVAALALLAFHLHLGCDLLGSGREWPIAYLWPAAELWIDPPAWAWALSSWQNSLIGLVATAACLWTARPLGRTVLELASPRIDAVAVAMVRRWTGAG